MSTRLDAAINAVHDALIALPSYTEPSRVRERDRTIALAVLGALAELERDEAAGRAAATRRIFDQIATVERHSRTAPVETAGEAPDPSPATVTDGEASIPPDASPSDLLTCPDCLAACRGKNGLGIHRSRTHGVMGPRNERREPAPLTCECGYEATSRQQLGGHNRWCGKKRRTEPVVPAQERPEKPVVLPTPDPVEEPLAATADIVYFCEHCTRRFPTLAACVAHEVHCGREPPTAAPLPSAGLIIRCGECDDFTVDADDPHAERELARHTYSGHGRGPTRLEQSKRMAS